MIKISFLYEHISKKVVNLLLPSTASAIFDRRWSAPYGGKSQRCAQKIILRSSGHQSPIERRIPTGNAMPRYFNRHLHTMVAREEISRHRRDFSSRGASSISSITIKYGERWGGGVGTTSSHMINEASSFSILLSPIPLWSFWKHIWLIRHMCLIVVVVLETCNCAFVPSTR